MEGTNTNFKKAYIPPVAESIFVHEEDLMQISAGGENEESDGPESWKHAKRSVFFDDDATEGEVESTDDW